MLNRVQFIEKVNDVYTHLYDLLHLRTHPLADALVVSPSLPEKKRERAFDLDLAVERSDKNPVYYIQNAHVRCAVM